MSVSVASEVGRDGQALVVRANPVEQGKKKESETRYGEEKVAEQEDNRGS